MNQNNRPHSRTKNVTQGSADLHKGKQVNLGGPVGFGGRGGSPQGNNTQSVSRSAAPARLNLKSLIVLAVIVLVLFLIFRGCAGKTSGGDIGGDWNSGTVGGNTQYQDYSYEKPDYSVSPLARDKRVTPLGGGRDTVTLMVYMCGTDLESKYGMATKDLTEMTRAELSDNVNIIVETGGCKEWKNSVVSNQTNQIYKVVSGGLSKVKENAGTGAMTDPKTLSDFITFCRENYPADRYALIFWDHGGGSVSGYGYDEKNPNSSSMTLSRIRTALDTANCTFDFIGFDACLMATLETALVCENYADYLLASEETEPGTGWYYTRWLSELSANPSKPTVDIAKTIIDDFVTSSVSSSSDAKVTLSLVDLAELHGTVPATFSDFASSTNEMIRSDGYKKVSNARAGVRQFSQKNQINQIDLVDFALRLDTAAAKSLASALEGCVKYNRSSIPNCHGISIYFPYESTKNVNSALSSYQALGMDDDYTACIRSFASMELGGQAAASASQSSSSSSGDIFGSLLSSLAGGGSSTSPLGVLGGTFTSGGSSAGGFSVDAGSIISMLSGLSGRSMPDEYSWVDTKLISDKATAIAANYLDASHIRATRKNGRSVLALTENEWQLVQSIELNVFADDGSGYIDLGLDNVFEFFNDDLLLSYDGTWLTLNGNVCAYYLVSDTEQKDGTWVTVGRIPALLNGTPVDLQVVFDNKNPDGVITGAYPMYMDGETDVQAKGCISVEKGDRIELLCDFYRYDGTYSASYTLGDAFTVPAGGLTIRNMKVNASGFSATYRVTDIYGNHYWVDAVKE